MKTLLLSVSLLMLAPLPSIVSAEPSQSAPSHESPRDTSHYNLEKGKPAIQGYDPVAYFPEAGGTPQKGRKEFAHEHRGVLYWFTSKANMDRFIADPDRFEPTYGGWCATAMADGGRKVEIDPKNFKVTEGRLFLFYKGVFQNAKPVWEKNEPGHTAEADGAWKGISGEEPRK